MGLVEEKLLARARRLAERIEDAPSVDREPILIFRLGAERFGLRMTSVATVAPFARVTPVPTAGRDVLGIMSIEGEIHAVYALDRVLDLPDSDREVEGGQVLALRDEARRIGVRVDAVEEIDHIDKSAPAAGRHFVRPVKSAPLILIEDLNSYFNVSGENR